MIRPLPGYEAAPYDALTRQLVELAELYRLVSSGCADCAAQARAALRMHVMGLGRFRLDELAVAAVRRLARSTILPDEFCGLEPRLAGWSAEYGLLTVDGEELTALGRVQARTQCLSRAEIEDLVLAAVLLFASSSITTSERPS